ncbi:MAG: RNA methyltransferase [Parcubacteria group bacterium]|nr:RNA methyltransferase [Parcubacteria group bacterium]
MGQQQKEIRRVYVILHNIRSVLNVGSIFRTADAAEVAKIYLTGFTPAPIDRFGRKRKDFEKSALGAEKTVVWEQREDFFPLLNELKMKGFLVIGIEQAPEAKDYKEIRAESPLAFVFGNEVTGLPPEVLSVCDEIAEIPMRGKKESLNVSVAAGIALFRMLDI